jgi:hypothetical protein
MNGDTATSWRDLADRLTADERTSLEYLEHNGVPPPVLDYARQEIEVRLVDIAYADLPAPPGATWAGSWEKNLTRDGWSRSLIWVEFGDDLCIDGRQQCDGTVERRIALNAADRDVILLDAAGACGWRPCWSRPPTHWTQSAVPVSSTGVANRARIARHAPNAPGCGCNAWSATLPARRAPPAPTTAPATCGRSNICVDEVRAAAPGDL